MVARYTADEVYVGDRDALEREMQGTLQTDLDRLETGVFLVSVQLLDVHAAPEVHEAFRDLASAAEDREREIIKGEQYRREREALARAKTHVLEQGSAGDRAATLGKAQGEASAFLSMLEALRQDPGLSRLRLRLDAFEKGLRNARLIVPLGDSIEVVLLDGDAAGEPGLDLPQEGAGEH